MILLIIFIIFYLNIYSPIYTHSCLNPNQRQGKGQIRAALLLISLLNKSPHWILLLSTSMQGNYPDSYLGSSNL